MKAVHSLRSSSLPLKITPEQSRENIWNAAVNLMGQILLNNVFI